MQKKYLILTLLFTVLFSSFSFAQFNDYTVKGGIQGLGILPDTDFANDDIKASYLGRALVRIKLAYIMDVEVGAGYGMVAGDDPSPNGDFWESSIMPVDLRLLFSPFNAALVNPYFYAGGGLLIWEVLDKPIYASPAVSEESGTDFFVPVGGGFEVKLSNGLLLDLTAGYTFAYTDDLNYYNNIDSDSKGANDGYWAFGLGLIYSGVSGSSDTDSDGLTLDQEKELGTDPDLADSDNDKISDGLELNQYNTNPLEADSDGDGLDDYAEVREYKTNPNLKDTDEDKLNDGDEINQYKTDPLRNDTDFDGLRDNVELNQTKTNPSKADSDKDGLNDGEEIERHKSDPNNWDTDGDGLSDGDEVLNYNTKPTMADTDGGSESDKTEIDRGTNPLNPSDDIILDVSSPIVLDGITFATGSAELTPESEKMLLKVLNTLNVNSDLKVEIRGYTDSQGKASSNLQLSQRRANSVRYWIVSKGITPNRVAARGYGEQDPIANNNTKVGRRLNRRIEFVKTN
ncbi:MAG: OmpA family protein [Ignavibacteriae bacterium]|nr:OmpA family protein [Ignavibacteriota bacterium]